jgi:hypothetical protein
MRYLCILLLSACTSLPLFGQFTYEHLMVDYESAITHENLQIIPVRGKDSFFRDIADPETRSRLNYVSLQEAMARGLLNIVDRGGVNRLLIDNLSDQPVMLLSGEIFRGGKQDRVIGSDMILLPRTTRNRVPVFCVEEKRWSRPKAWSCYHEGSMHLRRVADQSQNQSQVWREVAYELKLDNVSSGTRAYTSHSKNPQYAARERAYLQVFSLDAFANPNTIVGLIGVTGSVVIGCDVFASEDLFQQEYQRLIFS